MQQYSPAKLRLHVLLDYAFVLVGFAAPWALDYHAQGLATLYTLALATFGLALNIITNYPGGVWKLLPFKWHLYVEWASPPPFIIAPWIFFAEAGAMPYVLSVLGVGIVVNALLSRPTQVSLPAQV